MTSSLARRLTAAFVVIGFGSALLTAILINLAFGGRFDTYLGQQRAAREDQLASAFTSAYDPGRGWQAARLDQLAPAIAMTGADVRLVDPSGKPVWSLADSQMGPGMARMHREMTAAGPLLPQQHIPLTLRGRVVGELLVAQPKGTVPLVDQGFRRSVNWLLALGALLGGTIGVGAGVLVARRTVRPITELTHAARELQAGDRGRRAEVLGDDEISHLARAFNDLVDSLAREDAVRRAFAADVAHELRTPLAVLRSQVEAMQDGVVEPGPAAFDSLHDETLRLGRLTADLETMTSADSVEFDLRRERIDLADIVKSASSGLRHRFEEQRLNLVLATEPTVVLGDNTRLQQVVTNLLTNALKFVPGGGSVTVSTRHANGWVELGVDDDGHGITTADLPHIFDHFYRGHEVHTGGSGIGLAVVAALVHAHGGEVSAHNRSAGGASFLVRLPVARVAQTAPSRAGR